MAKKKPAMKRRNLGGEKRGPKEETLKLNGDWKAAIKLSFLKKKPEKGWPK
jgi:hypothetical protein